MIICHFRDLILYKICSCYPEIRNNLVHIKVLLYIHTVSDHNYLEKVNKDDSEIIFFGGYLTSL